MPSRYMPMLCHLGGKEFLERKGYLYEPKLDGVRMLLYKDEDRIELINRNNISKLTLYPELKQTAKHIKATRCVIDGEVIMYNDKGLPDFQLLMKRGRVAKGFLSGIQGPSHPTFVAFDLLELEGSSLIHEPLEERKKLLSALIKENDLIEVNLSTTQAQSLWKEVKKRGLEGIIAKKAQSAYLPGQRTWDWVKVKNLNTADVVIVGFSSQKRHVSSLCMALYRNNQLFYVGRVGTGFNEKILEDLKIHMSPLRQSQPPVINPPPEQLTWISPKLVAEVEYLMVTSDDQFRASVFKGIRDDKPPKECTWEDQIKK